MNIVVTPLHSRPEMFKVWSELVKKANGASDLFYLFCLDYGYDEKYLDLIYEFPFECSIIEMPETAYKLGKQSNNVLNGMVSAAKHADNLVYYLEEDIFPGKDFFLWHLNIHLKETDIFCSIATKANDTRYDFKIDKDHYYLTSEPDYQSWGSCFKKEVILDMIYPQFNESYLTDPTGYCLRHWPKSFIGSKWTEQDGLIRRILEASPLQVAFPCYPFAFHAGFYGYNRQPQIMRKSYDEKLELIRKVCFDADLMRLYSIYQDSEVIDLDTTFDETKKIVTKNLTSKQ
jgi:hypothetical protein